MFFCLFCESSSEQLRFVNRNLQATRGNMQAQSRDPSGIHTFGVASGWCVDSSSQFGANANSSPVWIGLNLPVRLVWLAGSPQAAPSFPFSSPKPTKSSLVNSEFVGCFLVFDPLTTSLSFELICELSQCSKCINFSAFELCGGFPGTISLCFLSELLQSSVKPDERYFFIWPQTADQQKQHFARMESNNCECARCIIFWPCVNCGWAFSRFKQPKWGKIEDV